MFGVYLLIDHHQRGVPTTVLMPTWVPFCPAWLPVYLGLMLVTWFLPVTIRDPRRFRAFLLANVCGWLLVVPWWVITPTTMPRPPLPEGFWSYAFDCVWSTDAPNNVVPCLHGTGPMVAAWFTGRDHPRWRWPMAVMLVLALPSIAFVWQHRPVDILLGSVAAVVGIIIGEVWSRKEQTSLKVMEKLTA